MNCRAATNSRRKSISPIGSGPMLWSIWTIVGCGDTPADDDEDISLSKSPEITRSVISFPHHPSYSVCASPSVSFFQFPRRSRKPGSVIVVVRECCEEPRPFECGSSEGGVRKSPRLDRFSGLLIRVGHYHLTFSSFCPFFPYHQPLTIVLFQPMKVQQPTNGASLTVKLPNEAGVTDVIDLSNLYHVP